MDSKIVQHLLNLSRTGELENMVADCKVVPVDLEASSTAEDIDTVELGRLDWSPRKNWVENEGGLPKYIEDVAIGIMKGTGMPREQAIPIAISRIKAWARGADGVHPDTQAKAIAALAQWEAMKKKAAARRLAKKAK